MLRAVIREETHARDHVPRPTLWRSLLGWGGEMFEFGRRAVNPLPVQEAEPRPGSWARCSQGFIER